MREEDPSLQLPAEATELAWPELWPGDEMTLPSQEWLSEHLLRSAQATARGHGTWLWFSRALERKALMQSWIIWSI